LSRHNDHNGRVELLAVVDEVDPPLGHLRLERSVEVSVGHGAIEVRDVTTNLGSIEEAAPILYHVNLGYPLIAEATQISVSSSGVLPRDEDSKEQLDLALHPGPVNPLAPEAVFEHVLTSDQAGWASAEVLNPVVGLRFRLAWRTNELPRFHQWIRRSPGWYVVGLEPANCSVGGRAYDRAEGRLPVLGPGQQRETHLRFEITQA
jgi:hypothetical protein